MKIKSKYLQLDYLLLFLTLFLISIKFIFSYLLVEPSYWIRHLSTNYLKYNPLGLPRDISSQLEYLIIPTIFIFIFLNFSFLGRFKNVLLLIFGLFFLNIITSFYNNIDLLNSFRHTLKLISPILFFIMLLTFFNKKKVDLMKLMTRMIILVCALAIIGLVIFDISMNRKTVQWPIYFANIHSHSYMLFSAFVGISYILHIKSQNLKLFSFFLFSFFIISYGYGVRTVIIIYLIFIICVTFVKSSFFKYIWLQLLYVFPFLVIGVLTFLSEIEINKFSSGRIDMYIEKLKIFENYNFLELLLGRGYGSDFIKTETWWWAEKGSHSDFITFFAENGMLYLLLFIVLILFLSPFKTKINLIFSSLILGYFVSSIISNGIANRPISGYLFFMVLAFIYSRVNSKNILIN